LIFQGDVSNLSPTPTIIVNLLLFVQNANLPYQPLAQQYRHRIARFFEESSAAHEHDGHVAAEVPKKYHLLLV
jgi:hypothetical protein